MHCNIIKVQVEKKTINPHPEIAEGFEKGEKYLFWKKNLVIRAF